MNCQQYQQKILESLAADEGVRAEELMTHLNSCAACRKFHTAQQDLFHSIDGGLRSLANPPVPVSLLPALRARLNEKSFANRAHLRGWSWSLIAATAVVIMAASVSHPLRHPATPPALSYPASAASATRSVEDLQPRAQSHREAPRNAARIPNAKRASAAAAPSNAPEVIVLAEERQAFAKFVAEVPEQPKVALALAHPALVAADDAVEIALLQIDGLDVKPLEGSASE
jgi:hypothetical protein